MLLMQMLHMRRTHHFVPENNHWKHATGQNTWSVSSRSRCRVVYTLTLQDATASCSPVPETSSHVTKSPENEKSPDQSSKNASNLESLQKADQDTTPVAWLYLFTCGLGLAIWIISSILRTLCLLRPKSEAKVRARKFFAASCSPVVMGRILCLQRSWNYTGMSSAEGGSVCRRCGRNHRVTRRCFLFHIRFG